MSEIVQWRNEALETKQLYPLLIVSIFIVVFLEIHPFQDGNGRLSRVLTSLLLLQAGYTYEPYSSLESVIEKSKEGYYLALRQTQGTIRTDERTKLATVGDFLLKGITRANAKFSQEGRTREDHSLGLARAIYPDPRLCKRAWLRDW